MNNIEIEKEIERLTLLLRWEKGYVCAIDLLMGLNFLSKKDYEDWRFGRVGYLERVCKVNLSKLTLVNKTMRKVARDLKLVGSLTGYNRYGKGISPRLTFSKSGDKNIEEAYATHYVDKERIRELKSPKEPSGE
jgi:hypothetical protein